MQLPIAMRRRHDCVAVMNRAITDYSSFEASRSFLAESGLETMLSELAADNLSTLLELERSGKVSRAVLNRPELLHFAALCEAESTTVDALVQVVSSRLARSYFPLPGIWSSYADALVAFMSGSVATAQVPKMVKGAAARYLPYIHFMCAEPEDRAAAALEAELSFKRWNREKRTTDWLGLDGDGKIPVAWDFRLAALRLGANNSFKADASGAA